MAANWIRSNSIQCFRTLDVSITPGLPKQPGIGGIKLISFESERAAPNRFLPDSSISNLHGVGIQAFFVFFGRSVVIRSEGSRIFALPQCALPFRNWMANMSSRELSPVKPDTTCVRFSNKGDAFHSSGC